MDWMSNISAAGTAPINFNWLKDLVTVRCIIIELLRAIGLKLLVLRLTWDRKINRQIKRYSSQIAYNFMLVTLYIITEFFIIKIIFLEFLKLIIPISFIFQLVMSHVVSNLKPLTYHEFTVLNCCRFWTLNQIFTRI